MVSYYGIDLNATEVSIDTKRKFAEHHFLGIDGSYIEDLGAEAMIVSGRGKFYGANCYKQYKKLQNVVANKGRHVTKVSEISGSWTGLMTSLKVSLLDPLFVEFDFEIVMHTTINSISTIKVKKTKYAYYKTKKKNQNLKSIVNAMNKKYKKKWTEKQVMSWNKIKNKKKIAKGKKLKFKYTVTETKVVK